MKVQVCTWKSCWGKFSKYILTRLENDIKFYDWKNIEVEESLCMWECKKSPNIMIEREKYNYVNPAKASELILKKLEEKAKQEKQKAEKSKKKK